MQQSELESEQKKSRRFFLAGLVTFLTSLSLIMLGAFRSFIPNVQSGKPLRFKAGMPQDFPDNTATYIEDQKVFIVRKGNGYLALSSICTHLGCTVRSESSGEGFFCPCHGSRYKVDGTNYAGPAPKALVAYEVSLGPLGELFVDKRATVSRTEMFKI